MFARQLQKQIFQFAFIWTLTIFKFIPMSLVIVSLRKTTTTQTCGPHITKLSLTTRPNVHMAAAIFVLYPMFNGGNHTQLSSRDHAIPSPCSIAFVSLTLKYDLKLCMVENTITFAVATCIIKSSKWFGMALKRTVGFNSTFRSVCSDRLLEKAFKDARHYW